MRKARSIDLMRRVHAFRIECSGRILDQRDVVAKLHAETSGGFDADVRYKTDQDDFLDSPLCELGVEISINETALSPVLQHNDVASAGAKFGMKLSTPTSGGEALALVRSNLGWVHMFPANVVAFAPAVDRKSTRLNSSHVRIS